MSVMHASPWRPNIPREAIKQNSKITWLSYLQRIWQTFCNIYLMVKPCIANFHFLNLNIHARSYAGSRHHGVAGPVSQVARVRWVFERITLQGFEKIILQGGNEPWTSSWGFRISVPRKKALNILNLTLPKSLDTVWQVQCGSVCSWSSVRWVKPLRPQVSHL